MSNKIRCSNAECESRTNEEDCPPAFNITVSVDENTEIIGDSLHKEAPDNFDCCRCDKPAEIASHFKVVWDNGASASGQFDEEFLTRDKADEYGKSWAAESNARDGLDPESEESYSYEVTEVFDE